MAFDANKRAQAHWKENCQNIASQFTQPCGAGILSSLWLLAAIPSSLTFD